MPHVCRGMPNGTYAESVDTASVAGLMPAGGVTSSVSGKKAVTTRPELIIDGRTLGALGVKSVDSWNSSFGGCSQTQQMAATGAYCPCLARVRCGSCSCRSQQCLAQCSFGSVCGTGFILGTPAEKQLAAVAAGCASVVVCRASPSQKAAVVRMMMEYEVSALWPSTVTHCSRGDSSDAS